MEKKFVANKAVLVNQQGKILLVRDTGKLDHEGADGKWDFPGGRMDVGETPQEGLVRELQEEIGVTVQDIQIGVPIHVGLWSCGGDVHNNPIVGIFYIVHLIGNPEIRLSDEHNELRWIDPRLAPPNCDPLPGNGVLEAYRLHEGIIAATGKEIKGHEGLGLIQLFTGNGKGKTTAAIGEIVRMVGAGKKAAIIFFDKGGTHYMERKVFDALTVEDHERGLGRVEWFAYGRDRIDPVSGCFDFSVTEQDRELGTQGLAKALELFQSDQYDLVVLDEMNSTTDLGMVSVDAVLCVLDAKPDRMELILTGRNAPQAFLDRAHLVTEMRLRKHYFYSGVKAREGIDY
ncbi:cob(I)yrinic acid a,c-diamide adenosyltransferase [Candidatus Uhrbacteria bacterium]|nr:cob(I)yrinic acid a,c-diamide adenosyltransferase [Candidatus Uhrbacteria bacterium]